MSDVPTKIAFFGLDAAGFDAAVAAWGWPRFRAQQVRDWVYGKLVADPALMTNLAKADREALRERVDFPTAAVTAHQRSTDGTQKLLLTWPTEPGRAGPDRGDTPRLPDAPSANAETVMIPDADRRTACVSSQLGCPVGCKFCASGLEGVKGNLTAGRIVEQIYHLNAFLQQRGDPVGRITNVVFMGMGEPLANYANVMDAIRILHEPDCFNIGGRKITISTVGVPPKMRELAREGLPINLAISLHAPN